MAREKSEGKRKRCPVGTRWDKDKEKCVPNRNKKKDKIDPKDYE